MSTKKVMIVDDSKLMRNHVRITLKERGIEVVEAGTATWFSSALLENKGDIDLVIMDLMLEGSNGYDLIDKMREKEDYRDIPVVILTSQRDMENILKGREYNVLDYIIKPINDNEFIDRIEKALASN